MLSEKKPFSGLLADAAGACAPSSLNTCDVGAAEARGAVPPVGVEIIRVVLICAAGAPVVWGGGLGEALRAFIGGTQVEGCVVEGGLVGGPAAVGLPDG